jgi:hypothetical protein
MQQTDQKPHHWNFLGMASLGGSFIELDYWPQESRTSEAPNQDGLGIGLHGEGLSLPRHGHNICHAPTAASPTSNFQVLVSPLPRYQRLCPPPPRGERHQPQPNPLSAVSAGFSRAVYRWKRWPALFPLFSRITAQLQDLLTVQDLSEEASRLVINVRHSLCVWPARRISFRMPIVADPASLYSGPCRSESRIHL